MKRNKKRFTCENHYLSLKFFNLRHIMRRLKYFLLAWVNGELPRRSILELIPRFEESELIEDNNFNKLICIGWKDDKLSKSHWNEIRHFVSSNPDWKFCFMDNSHQQKWMEENFGKHQIYRAYRGTLFEAARNDIFRYCFVYTYGCGYFAVNIVANRPLTEIIGKVEKMFLILSATTLSYSPRRLRETALEIYQGKSFVMAVVIASKGHPVLERVINNICDRFQIVKGQKFGRIDRAIWWYTGPYLFADSVTEYVAENREKTLKELGLSYLPYLFGNALTRPYSARYRFMSGPSYIGYKNCEIAVDGV